MLAATRLNRGRASPGKKQDHIADVLWRLIQTALTPFHAARYAQQSTPCVDQDVAAQFFLG